MGWLGEWCLKSFSQYTLLDPLELSLFLISHILLKYKAAGKFCMFSCCCEYFLAPSLWSRSKSTETSCGLTNSLRFIGDLLGENLWDFQAQQGTVESSPVGYIQQVADVGGRYSIERANQSLVRCTSLHPDCVSLKWKTGVWRSHLICRSPLFILLYPPLFILAALTTGLLCCTDICKIWKTYFELWDFSDFDLKPSATASRTWKRQRLLLVVRLTARRLLVATNPEPPLCFRNQHFILKLPIIARLIAAQTLCLLVCEAITFVCVCVLIRDRAI